MKIGMISQWYEPETGSAAHPTAASPMARRSSGDTAGDAALGTMPAVQPRRALLPVLVAIAVLLGACSSDETGQVPDTGAPTGQTAPPVGGPKADPATAAATRAVVNGSSIDVYDSPDAAEPSSTLANPWIYEGANGETAPIERVFLVQEQQGDWVKVYTGVEPSFSEGWVRAADVTLQPVEYQVDVYLDQYKLTVTKAGQPFMDTTVALGTADRPTAGGTYYTTVLLQPPNPDGPYGPFAYGLSGYSDDPAVREQFGGNGQLGLHGTNQPDLLGTNVSNGCIRLANEDITELAEVLPLGTPVYVHA